MKQKIVLIPVLLYISALVACTTVTPVPAIPTNTVKQNTPTLQPTSTIVPTEPTVQIPDLLKTQSIAIDDNWSGLSAAAPIVQSFLLERDLDDFKGRASFDVAGYSNKPLSASSDIQVPEASIKKFFEKLSETVLETGKYIPTFEHTDDYPSISILLKFPEGSILFRTESQGKFHTPWEVLVEEGSQTKKYVTYSTAPTEALKILNRYLKKDSLDRLMKAAEILPSGCGNTAAMIPGGYLEKALSGVYAGTTVNIQVEDDYWPVNFEISTATFQAGTGIDIEYISSTDIESKQTFNLEIIPPDIKLVTWHELPALVANGQVVDIAKFLPDEYMRDQFNQNWLDLARLNGPDGPIMAGVWNSYDNWSTVWYPKDKFIAAGYEVPETWDELLQLTDQIAMDGNVPWCIGAGEGTGYGLTMWMTNLMLRTSSLDNYDRWSKGELAFNSPEVKDTLDYLSSIWFDDDYIYGGHLAINEQNAYDLFHELLSDPPKCWLYLMGSWVNQFIPPDLTYLTPGVSYDYFNFPEVEGNTDSRFLVNGSLFTMLADRPEVRAVMEYFTRASSMQLWAQEGQGTLAHNDQCLDWYTNPIHRQIAEAMLEAEVIRLDALVLMPEPVREAFMQEITNYIDGQTDRTTALKNIDSSWPDR